MTMSGMERRRLEAVKIATRLCLARKETGVKEVLREADQISAYIKKGGTEEKSESIR